MSRKGVKYRSSWTLHDENIENVERVSFTPEIQRELGCAIGEHVFLEYPWVYVARDAVLKLVNEMGSPLEPYRDKVEAYGGDNFLVGYSSTQLTANSFVICLTEDAKSTIEKRNAEINRRIWHDVTEKIGKIGKSWKSHGSEAALEDSLVRKTRELYEVEICLPFKFLGLNRELHDRTSGGSWDSYVELIPYEKFENIEKKCISRMIQTHFEPREIEVQTYPGYPKNAWTQYIYEDTLRSETDNGEAEKEKSIEEKSESEEKSNIEEGSREEASREETDVEQKPARSALELFLDDRAQEMIDAVRYNTVVNVHADDIETLERSPGSEIDRPRNEITHEERVSLLDLRFTAGKVVSDASWHPSLVEYVAISYVAAPHLRDEDIVAPKTAPTVLLWSLADSLRPRLLLQCHQEIHRISFCPTSADFIVGGSVSGRVIVWNVSGRIEEHRIEKNGQVSVELDSWTRDSVPAASAFMESDQSHEMTIRGIQWLPDNYRIESSGKLTRLSTRSSCQFLTTSEDGTVAIWDLLKYSVTSQLKPRSCKDTEDTFRPTYRLRLSTDTFFTPLCLCLPSDSVFQESVKHEMNPAEVDRTKRLWIGTAQGHFACCSWEGQVFDVETSGLEECKLFSCCFAHDGPVTAILRSPHLPDVLLTIGGRVFAIWKDDYLDSPLFRRRSDCVYTVCCWSNQPGTFLIGTYLGDVEIWDIKSRTNKPVFKRVISMKPITLLSLQESCKRDFRLIGVADYNSAFHVFEEAKELEDDIVERLDWFEEYVWREVRRKKIFHSWEKDFLENHPTAVARRQTRAEEERKQKLETTRLKLQKEHEERLRLEAEEQLRKVPKSKNTIWKLQQQERMKETLLKKKKLVPRELEEKRRPLVFLAEERKLKMVKAKNKVLLQDEYFDKAVSQEFPEYYLQDEENESLLEKPKIEINEETIAALLKEFVKVRDEARRKITEKLYVPKFDWKFFANKRKEKLINVKNS